MNESAPPTTSPPKSGLLARFEGAPWTLGLVVTNVLVFLAEARVGFPMSVLSVPARTLLAFGANDALYTVAEGRFETLVTACFLHGSILHLAFNMVALSDAGAFVERSVGRGRFVPVYLLSGIVGSVASALYGYLVDGRFSVGASGAICGLVAAAMVLGIRTQGIRGKLTRSMGMWLLSVLFLGAFFGFDNAAHAGGAVAGALIAASWRRGHVYAKWKEHLFLALSVAVIVASAGRVAYRSRVDPLAFAAPEQHLQAAQNALLLGKCREADRTLRRAVRLGAEKDTAEGLFRQIKLRCPKKQG